jgi:hypothetical protein
MPQLPVTQHFNKLSEEEAEAIAIVIEECSEVIKCCTKILRHGVMSCYPNGETNKSALTRESGDVDASLEKLIRLGIIDIDQRYKQYRIKLDNYNPWLHHDSANEKKEPRRADWEGPF